MTVEDDRLIDLPLKPSAVNVLRVSGSTGSGAFTSYVRKRGEPDGRTASDASTQITKVHLYSIEYDFELYIKIEYFICLEFDWSVDYAHDIEP